MNSDLQKRMCTKVGEWQYVFVAATYYTLHQATLFHLHHADGA